MLLHGFAGPDPSAVAREEDSVDFSNVERRSATKKGNWMGRDAAVLKPCFSHPTPWSRPWRETAAGAFGCSESGGGSTMRYSAFALAQNPVVSQGQLGLDAGQREKQCLPQGT